MDWNSPAERHRLLERVGPSSYNEMFAAHRKASVVATCAGHEIRAVQSRFGRLYHVGKTDRAFSTLAEAETYARTQGHHAGALYDEYKEWCKANALPHISADELLYDRLLDECAADADKTAAQIAWLKNFIERWEAAT